MPDNNVVDLDLIYKQKIIKEVEEIRQSNYDVLKGFSNLGSKEHLDSLYKFEQDTQLAFISVFNKETDPCYGFFGFTAFGNETDNFFHTLFVRSTFSTYNKRTGGGRDTVTPDEDGSFFETLPIVMSTRYVECPSPYFDKTKPIESIYDYLNNGKGISYFLSLLINIIAPYLKTKPPFILTSVNEISLHDDVFNTKKLLQITLDNGEHHLLIKIDINLCNKEIHDYRLRSMN